jgi:hypothetical protein
VCDNCGRSFRESGTLARHLKSRIPCTRKMSGQIPRYGFSGMSKNPVNVEHKTLQILITKAQDFPAKQTTVEENRTDIPILANRKVFYIFLSFHKSNNEFCRG